MHEASEVVMVNYKKVVMIFLGLIFLMIMIISAGDLVYTSVNPHILFAGSAMIIEIVIMAIAGFIGVIVLSPAFTSKHKRKTFQKGVLIIAFLVYLTILITILFGKAVYLRNIAYAPSVGLKGRISDANIIPFRTISIYIYALSKHTINLSIILDNLLGNFVLFMPMGLFLPCLVPVSRKKHYLIVVITLLLIEIAQLFTGRGIFDIDDIMLNFAGFLIAYIIVNSSFVKKITNKFL